MRTDSAVVSPPKPSAVKTGRVVIERPPTLDRDGKFRVFNWVNSVKVNVPETDWSDGPENVAVCAKVVEELPLLMMERSPEMVVMPPRLTVAIVGEMTTFPSTFVHAVRVVRSEADSMLKVADVQAGFAEVVEVWAKRQVSMIHKY